MTELELTDYQTFITSKARENYFNAVKQYYDYVLFTEENNQYQLYLFTKKYDQVEERWRPLMYKEFYNGGICYTND